MKQINCPFCKLVVSGEDADTLLANHITGTHAGMVIPSVPVEEIKQALETPTFTKVEPKQVVKNPKKKAKKKFW